MQRTAIYMFVAMLSIGLAVGAQDEGLSQSPGLQPAEIEVSSVWVRLDGAHLAGGDRLEISSGADLAPAIQSRLSWHEVQDGRWQAVPGSASSSGDAVTWLDFGLLPPDAEVAVATVRRAQDGAREIRLERTITRESASGALVVRPFIRVEQWRGVALDLADAPPDLRRDAAGRVEVSLDDPRASALIARAGRSEPFVRARATAVGSETGSTTINQAFTDAICGADPWLGRSITISAAPSGAEVLELDLEYHIYHSIDIDRFRTGLWHNTGTGWIDQLVVYDASQSGSNWLHRTQNGLTPSLYVGDPVNADYILGSCNIHGEEEAYLDEWTITVYYTEPGPTIDLIADSVTVASGTVTAGSSLGFGFSGHVGGSGSVGSDVVVGVYLADNAALTTNPVWLDNRTYPSADDPGDGFSENVSSYSVTVPSSVSPGSYHIGIVVDDGNQVAETNEGNNVRSVALTVNAPAQPNLRMVDCSVSSGTVAPGEQVTLSWRAENAGGAATPTFEREAFLSSNGTYSFGSDTSLDRRQESGGWAAGYTTGSRSVNVTVPSGTSDGQYQIGMALDITGAVSESDESDNVCMAALTVSSAPAGTTRWLIPAAASAPGVGSSNWKTQVSVVNPTSASRQARLYFVAKGAAWPGVLLAGPYNLSPNQSVFLDDPLLSQSPVTGLVYVQLDEPGPVVTSRTFNLAGDGSTFGQGIPAQPLDGVTAPTELILPMVHSEPDVFRTNLGLIQADSGNYRVEVSIYSSGGTLLATKTYTRSFAYDQVTNVFQDMGLGSTAVQGAWIKVRLVDGSPSYWTCYASVVDSASGDPTYIAPEGASN